MSDLLHEGFVVVIGHTQDLDLPRRYMDGEQDIGRLLPQPAPDVRCEEVRRHDLGSVLGDELLQGGLAATPLWIQGLDAAEGAADQQDHDRPGQLPAQNDASLPADIGDSPDSVLAQSTLPCSRPRGRARSVWRSGAASAADHIAVDLAVGHQRD
jgi:hypothetical protein